LNARLENRETCTSLYAFTTSVGYHQLFSNRRDFDTGVDVFANGAEAVSTETARASTAPA
jgi:hypothetical protein